MILLGDCMSRLSEIESKSIQCCVTSPPYWGLRDYGVEGQLGLEKTIAEYVGALRMVFEQINRVLKDDGTLWLNLGDSYSALKPKDLVGVPWKVAFALQEDGWLLRQDIIWHKPNPMPESVTDRCTKSHEYIFLLTKNSKYYFNNEAIKEPSKFPGGPNNIRAAEEPPNSRLGKNANIYGSLHKIGPRELRNKRSVWSVTNKPFKGAHFATFPTDLIEPCILAGTRPGDTVLDPFFGAGTTGLVAQRHGRKHIGIELNEEYAKIAEKRISNE